MKCKTSCFNPGLFRDALHRFWPLPLCSFFLFFVSLVLPLYRYLRIAAASLLEGVPSYTIDRDIAQTVAGYVELLHWYQPCCCSITSTGRKKFSSISAFPCAAADYILPRCSPGF